MKTIYDVDKNFKANSNIEKEDIKFYSVLEAPFKLHGVFYEDLKFRRLPEEVAKSVSENVHFLHANTAGGRVRFITDSPYVAIYGKLDGVCKMQHFAMTGHAGFDMYIYEDGKARFNNNFNPNFDEPETYSAIYEFETGEERQLVINFPLYSNVCELYIGLSETASVKSAEPYSIEKPIVYYGSSITQGGCASRPGNSYQAFISRRFDCDYVNLGFSGSALAEPMMVDYLKGLEMSAFVLDYDHNAPDAEHLKNTHEPLFKAVREMHPDIPIVMMSRPHPRLTEGELKRLDIIKTTYNNAVANGDKNVYFIDGRKLMKYAGDDGTVDGCHPNDLGFYSMAKTLGDELQKIFNK